MLHSLLYVFVVAQLSCLRLVCADAYSEILHLRPLAGGSLFAGFSFDSITTAKNFESQHFQFFPRSLGQILQHARTKELHLRFSSGRWDDRSWGARPRQGKKEGGNGVELWAWVEADNMEMARANWLTLTNALSGLFCASLNFVDASRTIRPVSMFETDGWYANGTTNRLHLLHGSLPGEVVCTENLTPFLKLLPCKGKAGISSLLDGHKLFDSSWQTMAIDVFSICPLGGDNCDVVLESNIDMALDIERSMRPQDNPIPRPIPMANISCDTSKWYHGYGDVCMPLAGPSMASFNLEALFGRPLKGSCPLADADEDVCLDLTSGQEYTIQTEGKYKEVKQNKAVPCFKLSPTEDFDIHVGQGEEAPKLQTEAALYVERSLTGRGQERGGISTIISNPSHHQPVEITYLESLPWFVKPYLHTLKTRVHSTEPPIFEDDPSTTNSITSMFYRPGVDRQRATHLELNLTIPAATTLKLTYEFEKAILRYTEYPPDANRGFNVAPAIVRIRLPPSEFRPGPEYFMRTTSLLMYLPTPDFSMPYNVIILTSTVIALGFGSIYNILVRRFVSADEAKALQAGSLRRRLGGVMEKLKGRFSAKGKTE